MTGSGHPLPAAGGSYMRDPETGALTPVVEGDGPDAPAAEPTPKPTPKPTVKRAAKALVKEG